MTDLTSFIKSTLEDFSFRWKFIRRKVSVQDLYYYVYAWHPIPWKLPSFPPLSWLLEEILSHHVVYDVGANRGYITLALLAKYPTLNLIAFEPNPVIFNKLKANIELNHPNSSNIAIYSLGLGNHESKMHLHISSSDSASSFIQEHAQAHGDGIKTTAIVKVTTLDDLVFKRNFPPPNHIKIDTEGFERYVLEGAKKIIQTYKPKIYAEIHRKRALDNNLKEIQNALFKYDYRFHIEGNQIFCSC